MPVSCLRRRCAGARLGAIERTGAVDRVQKRRESVFVFIIGDALADPASNDLVQ